MVPPSMNSKIVKAGGWWSYPECVLSGEKPTANP